MTAHITTQINTMIAIATISPIPRPVRLEVEATLLMASSVLSDSAVDAVDHNSDVEFV
jgi:hypothetical protein